VFSTTWAGKYLAKIAGKDPSLFASCLTREVISQEIAAEYQVRHRVGIAAPCGGCRKRMSLRAR